MTQLGEVARFIRGVTFKPSDVLSEEDDDAIAVMRTKNVQATLDRSDVIAIPSRLVKRADQLLQAGDTLISSANSWHLVGKCCWVPHLDAPAAVGGFVTALRPDLRRVDARYLYHWFSSPRVQATVRSFGNQTTNIANLNLKRCEALKIPLPSLDEQRRIAAILDQADDLRATRRRALDQLDELALSLADELLDGVPVTRPLRQVAVRVTVGHVGPTTEHFTSDGVAFLRTGNVGKGKVLLRDLRRISPEFHERLGKSRLRGGDVLVSRVISDEVRSAVLPPDLDGANCANIIIVTPGPDLRSEVLCHFLRTPRAQQALMGRRVGSAQSVVNTKVLQEMQVPLPPRPDQDKFCSRLAALDGQRLMHEESLSQLDALAAAMQNDAFGGRP